MSKDRARSRARRSVTSGPLRLVTGSSPVGRATGTLARRQHRQTTALAGVLVLVNLLVWVLRGDWPAVLGALVVTLLLFPVLRVLLFDRR